jgi:hypothetical protein
MTNTIGTRPQRLEQRNRAHNTRVLEQIVTEALRAISDEDLAGARLPGVRDPSQKQKIAILCPLGPTVAGIKFKPFLFLTVSRQQGHPFRQAKVSGVR